MYEYMHSRVLFPRRELHLWNATRLALLLLLPASPKVLALVVVVVDEWSVKETLLTYYYYFHIHVIHRHLVIENP